MAPVEATNGHNVEEDSMSKILSMINGDGEDSYTQNSLWQNAATDKSFPILGKALQQVAIPSKGPIVVSDLGCSSGPRTLINVKFITETMVKRAKGFRLGAVPADFQAFSYDLPSTDFNFLFNLIANESLLFHSAGVPGSLYDRLFSNSFVNVFFSSHTLHFLSQVQLAPVHFSLQIEERISHLSGPCQPVSGFDHTMPVSMYDDLHGLLLRITLRLFGRLSIQSGMQRTTPGTADVIDEVNRSSPSGDQLLLHSELMPAGLAGDGPQRLSLDLLPSLPQGADAIWSLAGEQKVSCCGCSVSVAAVEREPFADVFFGLDYSRSTGQQAKVRLTMEQVEFGVHNCCTQNCSATNQSSCHKTCETVFIHKITIQVCPKSWAQASHRLQVQPQHTAEVFTLQHTSNLSFQMPFLHPREASITYQTGSRISHSTPAFGWSPGYKDVDTNSVSWTWELYRFPNGRKLEFNKHRQGSRPLLGIRPSHTCVHPGSVLAKASWEIQLNADLQQLRLEWDVKVTLHTAVFQSARLLPGFSVTVGPTMTYEKLLAFPRR